MNGIILTRRTQSDVALDASGLQFDRFRDMDEHAIAKLELTAGRDRLELGDVFTVSGGRSTIVRVEGMVTDVHGLGTDLATSELIVAGNAGHGVGTRMCGGRIRIVGHVGDDAGNSMRGGTLVVDGSAGDRLGAAAPGARRGMLGGEIVVHGPVGREAGMRARRGLIVITGDAGADLARDIIAGTVLVAGSIGVRPGAGSKRGSIVALGGVNVPSTYRLACTFKSVFIRVLLTYLQRRFGLQFGEDMISGRYRRYCGDAGRPGRGEILEWIAS